MTVEPMMGVVSARATPAELHHLARLADAAGVEAKRAARELRRAATRHAEQPRFELQAREAVLLQATVGNCPRCLPRKLWPLVDQLAAEAREVHAREMARPRPGNRGREVNVGVCSRCGGQCSRPVPNAAAFECPCGVTRVSRAFIEGRMP